MFREIVTTNITLANPGIVIGGNIAAAVPGLTVKGDISATGTIYSTTISGTTISGTNIISNSATTNTLNTNSLITNAASASLISAYTIDFKNNITRNGSTQFISLSNISKSNAVDGDTPIWSASQNKWIPQSGKKGSQLRPNMSGILIFQASDGKNDSFCDNTWQSLKNIMQTLPAVRRNWDYYFLTPDVSKITICAYVSEAEIEIAFPLETTDSNSLNTWQDRLRTEYVTISSKPYISNFHRVAAGNNSSALNYFTVQLNGNLDCYIKIRKSDPPSFSAGIFLLDGI